MTKIGIITLSGYYNYGNRLQNYALQEALKQLGHDVETILHHETPPIDESTFSQKVIRKVKNFNIKNIQLKIDMKVNGEKYFLIREARLNAFKKFSNQYIKETNFNINKDNLPENLGESYDYFMAGSDQIWNPFYQYYKESNQAIEYLTFAPKEKRLSYAASFGISEIPEQFKERVQTGLNGMKSILVREQAGIDIVKKLTGRKASLVVDPTMLLTKEDWLYIAKEYKYKPKKKYLLTYFLGEKSRNVQKYITKIANENDLEIVHLEDRKYVEYYEADPGHFIDFINSASLFCTDSFHGVVFSILLETPFVIFKRVENGASMYSRIETLLKTFNLEKRQNEYLQKDLFTMDYSNVKFKLEQKRNDSFMILRESLRS